MLQVSGHVGLVPAECWGDDHKHAPKCRGPHEPWLSDPLEILIRRESYYRLLFGIAMGLVRMKAAGEIPKPDYKAAARAACGHNDN